MTRNERSRHSHSIVSENMGRNRRRRAVGGTDQSHDDEDARSGDDAILVVLESISCQSSDKVSPPEWTVELVDSIERETPSPIASNDVIQSVMGVGLQIVRGTLDKISNRHLKKVKKNTSCLSSPLRNVEHAKPTPIQLRIWPALLSSFQAREGSVSSATLNVVGIAPTGTGESTWHV